MSAPLDQVINVTPTCARCNKLLRLTYLGKIFVNSGNVFDNKHCFLVAKVVRGL